MICKGCGIKLQNNDKSKAGYAVNLNHDLCYSCFQLKHYMKDEHPLEKTHFPKIESEGLIIYLVSALHLNTLFMYNINNFYTNKMILLINQIDLFPKTVNFDEMIENIKSDYQTKLNNTIEIMPISALKGKYLDDLIETINHYKFKKVYLIGLQNSGKSTLVNQIAEYYNLETQILASKKPGLTKDFLKLSTPDFTLYDTPGVYLEGFVNDYLEFKDYYKLIPNKFKPYTYQLNEGQSVIVFGLIIISLIKGSGSFVFYGDTLKLHRTKYINVYDLFNRNKGKLFIPTTEEFETINFKLENKKYIINLLDLGYLVTKGPLTIEIYKPKNANVMINDGVINGLWEDNVKTFKGWW